ncbi:MAG: hypothetical protein DI549_10785 [Ancylobacter novellus]|uniref:Bacteriophage tail tape measure C-terminal domain-containing protein n=1 Tax=Ancylobacter novellus TaxID=921 RepID=A0A2W5R203_ANCNO|nr:MAG: hypothetical protein DI549_10785 [Ancylobacter novellus]
MADRNVGIRLQVIDGGKVKAELQGVGDAGAAALGALEGKSRQAAAAVNQLRTHEVTNLTAQLTDLGVQVLSGQSFATAMIQQGPQIAAVLGDRGVKGAVMGVGSALLSLVTPTTAILAGIVALGYGASFAFDAIVGETDDASEALERHDEIVRRITARYGDLEKGRNDAADAAQREMDILEANENERSRQKAYLADIAALISDLRDKSVSIGSAGDIAANPLFATYSGAFSQLAQSAKDGTPDIAAFRSEVARLSNEASDPAVREFGVAIYDAAAAAAKSGADFGLAGAAAERVGDQFALSTEQVKLFSAAMKEWDADQRLIAGLDRRADTASDPRQRYIDEALSRLKSTDEARRNEAAAAAGRAYDADQRQRASEKASREALNDARRQQNALEREAARLYDETRTSAEAYGVTLDRLNELASKGLITQETYQRALAQAADTMAAAKRVALDDATDAASGYKRAILDYIETAQDMASATEDIITDALGGAEDAFVSFVTTGKADFSSLVDSILADFARLALRQAMAPLLSGSSDLLGGLIGSLFGAPSGVSVAAHHAGGIGEGEASFRRTVDPALFENAPRYHTGRDPLGLLAGERAAIIKDDEGVFTRQQMRALGAGMSRPSTAPTVNLNIVNEAGVAVEQGPVTQRPDGQLDIDLILRVVKGEIAKDIANRGVVGTAIQNRYGLRAGKGQ